MSFRGFGTRRNPDPIEMTAVVRVLKQKERDNVEDTFITATVDITARTRRGRKVFESFRTISVPDKAFDSSFTLRKQLRQSLRSDLRRFVQAMESSN